MNTGKDHKDTGLQHENEENVNENATDTFETEGQDGPGHDTNENNALTELQAKYDSVNDKYVRLYSEFENYRRRTSKEKLDMLRTAEARVLGQFLPIADDFDRAIAGNENDNDIDSIKEGFKLIHHKLMHLMEQHGVKSMEALEQPFDAEFHEAITNVPAPNEALKGKVVDVAEKGYFYHDQVLRYAKVVVGQ